ncbi:hypothetical protein HYG86_00390 [Alkalicella caledoniensis]|uniref:Virulence-related protein n=1 Tax=Alkalicella caledoniensis TaxID=2731377 RepID=A0A7G9W3S9_ALKCA|nr:hypothetical protein [Alkalicella caledoniensis]QNO13341.1 hypothetical protein HYG86_00390 [Alkalicella caledoniensis]
MDRKEMAKRIGAHFGIKPKYLSVPSFAYEIKTATEVYTIDRHGDITKADGETITMDEILNQAVIEESTENLEEANAGEEPNTWEEGINEATAPTLEELEGVEIKLPIGDHTATSLKNILNMLYSKQQLIMMAFETDEPFMDEDFAEDLNKEEALDLEGLKKVTQRLGAERCPGLQINFEEKTLSFYLYGSDLSDERISAFKDLVALIAEYAKTLNRASFKQAQDDNPKYALRTWLIRIGMNGPEFKETRKTLLKHLEGSGAFRKVGASDETQM